MGIEEEKFTGKEGTPSRIRTATGADKKKVLEEIQAGGCCAWKGRGRCGAKPTQIVTWDGPEALVAAFQCWTCTFPTEETPCLTFLCERHEKDLLADIDPDIERSQKVEYFK